jgi:vacuolar-type H+-ATPase subunit H
MFLGWMRQRPGPGVPRLPGLPRIVLLHAAATSSYIRISLKKLASKLHFFNGVDMKEEESSFTESTEAAKSAEKRSEEPLFVKTIKEIRSVEEEHDRLINSAKEKAAQTIREAKEKALQERTKGEEDAVALKNSELKKGSKQVEAEVQEILAKTKEEGAKISRKKMDREEVTKMVKEFLSSN